VGCTCSFNGRSLKAIEGRDPERSQTCGGVSQRFSTSDVCLLGLRAFVSWLFLGLPSSFLPTVNPFTTNTHTHTHTQMASSLEKYDCTMKDTIKCKISECACVCMCVCACMRACACGGVVCGYGKAESIIWKKNNLSGIMLSQCSLHL